MNMNRYGMVSDRAISKVAVIILSAFFILSIGAFGTLHAQDGSAAQAGIGGRIPYAVATDGDWAVVGAPWHDGYKGAAYVLRREGTGWKLVQRLTLADPSEFDHFGASVSILGDRIVVGAPWHDVLRGAAYVLTRLGDRWEETQKLAAGDAAPESYFGASVKVAESGITIGTRASARRGQSTAYRFGFSGAVWSELAKGDAPAPESSAIVVGGRAVAGALGDEAQQEEALALIALVERESGETPPVAAPLALTPPGWVSATDGTLEESVKVTWESTGQKAIAYKVLRNGTLLSLVSSHDASYHDQTGTFGNVYSYCVVVTDMAAEETAPVCDDGSRIVFAPHDVIASDGHYTDAVRITWIDMSSVNTGYAIYRDGVAIDSVGANAGYCLDASAAAHPDSVYTYGVAAYVASGEQSAVVVDDGWRGVVLPPRDVVATQGRYLDRVVVT
jgi:hypothetical protein